MRLSPEADHEEAIDEVLGCRLEVVGLPIMEVERAARVAVAVVTDGM